MHDKYWKQNIDEYVQGTVNAIIGSGFNSIQKY